jgi:hydrophobic/amphiphilic exporter-1 (mainly G- bacteria), HAE1 family
LIALKPRSERKENSTAIIQRLRAKTSAVLGMATYFQNVQNINITGRISKSEFQYTLQSSDTETLYRVGPEMLEKISKLPGLRDVTGDLYVKNPQMTMEIDRVAAAVYGVTVDQVRQELYDCFGARQVSTIYTASNDYYVILECDPSVQADPTGLGKIFLKTNLNGQSTGGGAIAPARRPDL